MTENSSKIHLDTTDFSRVVSGWSLKRPHVATIVRRSKLKHHATEVGGVGAFLRTLLSRGGMREMLARTLGDNVQVEMMTKT